MGAVFNDCGARPRRNLQSRSSVRILSQNPQSESSNITSLIPNDLTAESDTRYPINNSVGVGALSMAYENDRSADREVIEIGRRSGSCSIAIVIANPSRSDRSARSQNSAKNRGMGEELLSSCRDHPSRQAGSAKGGVGLTLFVTSSLSPNMLRYRRTHPRQDQPGRVGPGPHSTVAGVTLCPNKAPPKKSALR